MKRTLAFTVSSALALTILSASSSSFAASAGAAADMMESLFEDTAIAKGKDFEIKRSQLEEAVINAKSSAAAAGVSFTPAERQLLEVRLLNDLVVSKILAAKATDADNARAREAAEKFIADARSKTTEEAFNAKLRLNKLTVDELRQKLIKEAIPSAVLERELKSKITVSDADVKKFYDDNPSKFEEPEAVRAAHILIQTKTPTGEDLPDDKKAAKRKQIEDLLKRVKDGEDFAKLARQYSEDPGSSETGGEYTFARGQMVPPFEAAAFALKKGEVSPVVTTTFGYHIIKQYEKKPARMVPFAEASPKIKDYLLQQEGAKMAPGYFAQLKKEAGVEILDEDLKAADAAAIKAAVQKAAEANTSDTKPAVKKSTK